MRAEKFKKYFEGKAWYNPDPSFDATDDTLLSDIEKENRDLIVEYEKEMGWKE